MFSKIVSTWTKDLIKSSVPRSPNQICARGGLVWFNACIAIGSSLSVSRSEKRMNLWTLPFVAASSAIATLFGIKLFFFLPSMQITHILMSNGFATFYKVTGLELWLGPMDENIKNKKSELNFDEMDVEYQMIDGVDDVDDVDDKINEELQSHPMRKSREALWDKIIEQRQQSELNS